MAILAKQHTVCFNEVHLTVARNTRYLVSTYGGPVAQLAKDMTKYCKKNVHEETLKRVLRNDTTWQVNIWDAVCVFFNVTGKQLMWEDIESIDRAFGRVRS